MFRHTSLFLLHFQDVLQYKLRSFVWMLVSSVNASILLIFWSAKIHSNPTQFSPADLSPLISYYLLVLLCGNVLISHSETDVAVRDIQKGELANYLLKPLSYLWLKFYGEITWRILSGFWAFILVLSVIGLGIEIQLTHDPLTILLFLISGILGFICSFLLTIWMGLLAIWATSTKGIFELYEVCMLLLAGFMMPLTQMPESIRSFLYWSPFASMLPIPIEILQGLHTIPHILSLLLRQGLWVGVMYLIYLFVWRAGVRTFSGVGQ